MTDPNNSKPYNRYYDKDGHYCETWIEEDDDERPDRDYWEEYENSNVCMDVDAD